MLTVNHNYSSLLKMAEKIKKQLLKTTDKALIFDYVDIYRNLCFAYSTCTEKCCYDVRELEDYDIFLLQQMQYQEKIKNSFLDHWKDHTELFLPICSAVNEYMREFEGSKAYSALVQNRTFSIQDDKYSERDILNAFFQEEEAELQFILEEMERKKHIFSTREDPYVIPLSPASNTLMFLPDRPSFLVDLVHELGHVKDFMEAENNLSDTDYSIYRYQNRSLYLEVNSFYYQQKFLEFLIHHNISKEEATYQLYQYYDKWSTGLFQDIKLLRSFEEGCEEKLDQRLVFQTFGDVQYSYGPMIASLLSSSSLLKEDFQTCQYDYFDPSKLEELGVHSSSVIKQVENNMKTYFKM